MKTTFWRRVLIVVVVAAAFYFALVVLSDIDAVGRAAGKFHWVYVVPIIALVCANYLVRAERWHGYLREVGLGLPRRRSYLLFVAGFAMLITPAKAGEAVKALLLKVEKDAPIERGVAVVFAERMSDMVGMVILIGVGSFAIAYGLLSLGIIVAVVLAILLVLNSENASSRLVGWLEGRPRLRKLGSMLDNALNDARKLLRGRSMARGTVLALIGWTLESLAFYLVLRGCHIEASVLEAVFIYTFSLVIGAISMLPGGMGTTEATMVGLLVSINASASTASFAVILIRVCALWLAVSIGVVSMTVYSRRNATMDSVS